VSEDIAKIGVEADTTGSDALAHSLDALAATGPKVEAAVASVDTSCVKLAASMRAAGASTGEIRVALSGLGVSAAGINAALATTSVAATATATSLAGLGASAAIISGEFRTTASIVAEASVASRTAWETTAQSIARSSGIASTGFHAAQLAALSFAEMLTGPVATGIAEFTTLSENINVANGLTDASFKRASASAAVFGDSLLGLAAIEASAAEGMSAIDLAAAKLAVTQEAAAASSNAFALGLYKSLTGVSDAQLGVATSATEEATAVVAANEAMATSAVASAEVQVAANTAIAGSALKVREPLVILRELSVGNYTRVAGSLSILAQAFGVLNAAILPLLTLLVTFGSVLALVKNQINSGTDAIGDLTVGMGLNAAQLDKVKNRYVTFGDTIHAIFKELGDEFKLTGVGGAVQSALDEVAHIFYVMLINVTGAVQGSVNDIALAFSSVGNILSGKGLPTGAQFAKAFADGFAQNKKDIDASFQHITDDAIEIAKKRIHKEAGKAPKEKQDSALNSAEKQLQQIDDQTEAYSKYNAVLSENSNELGKVIEQQKEDGQLKSIIARIELDTKLSLTEKTRIIRDLRFAQHELNQEEQIFAVLQGIARNDQNEQLLDREVSTLQLTNLERAKSIAQLKEEIDLKNKNIDPNSDVGKRAIASAVELAAHQEAAKEITDEFNASLQFQADLLNEIANNAQAMSSGLASSLGTVGTAIDGLTKAFTNYSALQAKFAEEQAKINKDGAQGSVEQTLLYKKEADAGVEYYADVLSSAKQFFNQGSAGYKLIQAAEAGYRAFQLASSIQAIVAKEAEAAATIAANTGETASGVTAGAAKIFADLGPLGFPVVAAMIAVMASLGFGGSGGGGASAAPVDIAKDRQAAQGAGSILGDAAGKSDSIAASLAQLSRNTNTDLEYSSQMVTSLRAIQNNIGSLTSLLAKQLSTGGLFDTSKLGLGSSSNPGFGSSIPLIGGLIGGLFGSSSSSTTLLDQGIRIAATTIGQAVAGGIQANAYQTTKTDSHSSSLFGLISSSSSSTKTNNTALSSDFTDSIGTIVSQLRSTVLGAATKLGVDGATSVIDSFSINLGTISFKDLTGTQIQDALNQVFGKLGDEITNAIFPQLASLQQVGEGSLQTLSRLVQEYSVVDDAAKTVGFTFAQTGIDSLAARDALVQASGGLDNFAKQASFFTSNFISGAAALVPIAKAVGDELSRLGLSGITTKDQFAKVVQGIDVTTSEGTALYAALQNVAPAFAKVADAAAAIDNTRLGLQITLLKDQGDAIGATALQRQKELAALDASLRPLQQLIYATEDYNTAQANVVTAQNNLNALTKTTLSLTQQTANTHSDLATAYNAEQSALKATINQFQGFATSLIAFQQTLISAGTNTSQQYRVSKALFNSTASAAQGGDATALGSLQQVANNFLTASQASSTTVRGYNADRASVISAVSLSVKAAQAQVDTATQQLYALDASVAGLGVLNKSVLSVRDAINNLTLAQTAETDASQLAIAKAQAELYAAQAALPGHATGLSYVPFNNYTMRAHEGEAVLTKQEAAQWRSSKGSNDNSALVAEIRAMRREMSATNDKVAKNTNDTNVFLRRFTGDGNNLNVKVVP
jgi:hypothetical protein